MGEFKAWSFNSVRLPVLREALQSAGLDWETCNHISATSSLSSAIHSTRAHALAINALTDIIVMAGLSQQRRVSIDAFPELDFSDEISVTTYNRRLASWSHKVQGGRSRLFIEMQQRIRDYLETSTVSPPIQRVLRKGRRDLLASLQSLISAGVNPETLVCVEDVA